MGNKRQNAPSRPVGLEKVAPGDIFSRAGALLGITLPPRGLLSGDKSFPLPADAGFLVVLVSFKLGEDA